MKTNVILCPLVSFPRSEVGFGVPGDPVSSATKDEGQNALASFTTHP
jgi:hypothetical protein